MDKRKLFTITIIATVIILILSTLNYLNGRGKDVVTIVSAPKDTTLLLDDSKIIKPGKQKIKSGTHKIKASRKGFENQIKQFSTVESKVVWFNLIPNSKEGQEYVKTHQGEYDKVYALAKTQTSKNVDLKIERYPIIKELPANIYPLFVINYGQSKKFPYDDLKIALYITTDTPSGKQDALSYIYTLGFDPSDYEIIFVKSSDRVEEDTGTGVGDIYDAGDAVNNHPNEVTEQGVR